MLLINFFILIYEINDSVHYIINWLKLSYPPIEKNQTKDIYFKMNEKEL